MGPTRMLLSKPVIAAVEGYAVAGGLELALWCDLRVAARDAVFGVFCRRWGVPLVDGGTVRLPRLIGHSHALDLILTGRGVSGDEALRMGLANRLTEPGERARRRARTLAHELAALPPICMREDRLVVIRTMGRIARRRHADRARGTHRQRWPPGSRSPARSGSREARVGTARPRRRVLESAHARHADSGTQRAHRRRRHVGVRSSPRNPPRPSRSPRSACTTAASARSSSIDHDDRAIGILTERDMIRLAAAGSDASTAKVSEWMTGDPDTIGPDVEARAAFTTLAEHGYRHIPVVEKADGGQKLVGIVSMRDLMRVAMIQPADAQAHEVPKGLEGVVVADTTVGDVRGLEGFYHYRQYSAVDLAEVAAARRRLVPALRGPAARDARASARRSPPTSRPRRAIPRRRRRRAPRDRARGRDVRAARRAAHRGLAVRRDARLPRRRTTSTTRRCATTRCRRARSCPR